MHSLFDRACDHRGAHMGNIGNNGRNAAHDSAKTTGLGGGIGAGMARDGVMNFT